jgi:hypothetical protein
MTATAMAERRVRRLGTPRDDYPVETRHQSRIRSRFAHKFAPVLTRCDPLSLGIASTLSYLG